MQHSRYTFKSLTEIDFKDGDRIKLNLKTGNIENLRNKEVYSAEPFSDVQFEVYQRGGLLGW